MLENLLDLAISSEASENEMNVQRLSRKGVGEIPEMVSTYYYYTLLCPLTGDIKYVGRTVDPKNRIRNHIYEAKKNNRNKRERWIMSLLRKNKRPILNIIWTGKITLSQAILGERSLIKRYKSRYDLKNEDDRGLGGRVSTVSVHQYDNDGKFIGSFINSNQASIVTGIKDCNIQRCCKNENGYGTKQAGGYFWSYIKYNKYPHKYIKNWRQLKGKPVVCVSQDGVEREYITAREAERQTGVNYKHISACCSGKRKTAGGYFWRFK